jgi:hypothetical protein
MIAADAARLIPERSDLPGLPRQSHSQEWPQKRRVGAGNMSWFDRTQLETALKLGKIPIDENTIVGLGNWLFVMEHVYQLPSRLRWVPPKYRLITSYNVAGGPSDELKYLGEALRNWLDADFKNKQLEVDLLASDAKMPRPEFIMECLTGLCRSVSNTIDFLQSSATNTKTIDSIETNLFINIYRKYIELSGSKKLSDDGPGILFIKECASILGVDCPKGVRRRIQQAIASSLEKPPQPPPDFSGLIEQLRVFFPESNN